MEHPDPPRYPSFRPSAVQPDELLVELHEVPAALEIAEYHIRLWHANSVPGNMPFRAYRAYAAHEALDEAGRVIDCLAETLRIEAVGTLTTPTTGPFRQIYAEASPTDAARCEPACSGDHAARREWVAIVQHVDSGGAE